MIDQELITRRALAHGLLALAPLADIAQAQNEHLPMRERRLADGDLGREELPVLALRPQLPRGQIECGIAQARREALECLGNALATGDLRQKHIDALADHLLLGVTEYARPGGVEGADEAGLIQQQHHVLDVIEDHLQVLA